MGLEATIATVIGSVIVAFLSGLFTFLGVRRRSRVDVQASLNTGFNSLIAELQEERNQLSDERREMRQILAEQDNEILELRTRVDRLLMVTTVFHNFIVASGLIPPPFNKNDILGQDTTGK